MYEAQLKPEASVWHTLATSVYCNSASGTSGSSRVTQIYSLAGGRVFFLSFTQQHMHLSKYSLTLLLLLLLLALGSLCSPGFNCPCGRRRCHRCIFKCVCERWRANTSYIHSFSESVHHPLTMTQWRVKKSARKKRVKVFPIALFAFSCNSLLAVNVLSVFFFSFLLKI